MKKIHVIASKSDAMRQYRLEQILLDIPEGILTKSQPQEPIPYNGASLFAEEETILMVEKITADRVKEIAGILKESDSTSFLISTDKCLASLSKVVKEHEGIVESFEGKKSPDIVRDFLASTPLNLSPPAREKIIQHVGESIDEVVPIVRVLSSVFKEELLSAEMVEPFLGGMGTRLIWGLTDAIDSGNVAQALLVLNSVLETSSPHAVIGLLHSHFKRMFYLYTIDKADPLDGSVGKEPYPVIKARRAINKYGKTVPLCYDLVSKAVGDMRGLSRVPPQMIMEILVSRLCAMKG